MSTETQFPSDTPSFELQDSGFESFAASENLSSIRTELLRWFAAQKREMPWRETRDPYCIWLSEIMLQQTRVDTVRAYYLKFLKHFKTVQDLAAADIEDVLTLWSGLGYYRRARNLHKAANVVIDTFDGVFPSRFEDILSLPGVGRYTAGAISSIAFGLERAAVDGNVHRVMSRLFCIEEIKGSKELDKQSWFWAQNMVQGEHPGDFNQSLMELGATICTPRSPTCLLCPIQPWCGAFQEGKTHELPYPKPKQKVKPMYVTWGLLRRSQKVLLVQRPHEGLFAGMWELPGLYADSEAVAPDEALLQQMEHMGLDGTLRGEALEYTHILSHRKLHISVLQSHTLKGRIKLPKAQWKWIEASDLDTLALSSITRKILEHAFSVEG